VAAERARVVAILDWLQTLDRGDGGTTATTELLQHRSS
jgi:hypothetical protein